MNDQDVLCQKRSDGEGDKKTWAWNYCMFDRGVCYAEHRPDDDVGCPEEKLLLEMAFEKCSDRKDSNIGLMGGRPF